MFRLDEDRVVDATLSGGLARYINHACNPNCVTETVDVDRELRIIIFAKRRINRGEEVISCFIRANQELRIHIMSNNVFVLAVV